MRGSNDGPLKREELWWEFYPSVLASPDSLCVLKSSEMYLSGRMDKFKNYFLRDEDSIRSGWVRAPNPEHQMLKN